MLINLVLLVIFIPLLSQYRYFKLRSFRVRSSVLFAVIISVMSDRKSLKQFYRLWYEYLKLSQQKLKWNKKELEFYKDWGEVNSYKNFDEWWNDKGDIFGDIRVEKGYKRNEDNLNISIPLTQPITTSLNQIREIITDEIKERLSVIYGRSIKDGDISNMIKLPSQKFPIPKQPKYQTINDDLIVYRDVYLKRNNKVVNMDLVNECINHFKNRKINKNIPSFLKFNNDEISMIRNVRRSIKRVEEGLKRVKTGKFIR